MTKTKWTEEEIWRSRIEGWLSQRWKGNNEDLEPKLWKDQKQEKKGGNKRKH